jgi:hypothetical protein
VPGEQIVPERMPVLYGSVNRAIQYGVRRRRYCVTFGSGTSISLSGCMDAIGQPIISPSDAEQAYTSMLLYMVPGSLMTDAEFLPALMYLTSHFMTGSVCGLQTLTYNLRYHMRDWLNWGFFDQALCEEICPELT